VKAAAAHLIFKELTADFAFDGRRGPPDNATGCSDLGAEKAVNSALGGRT
jgi:hypothetical protein